MPDLPAWTSLPLHPSGFWDSAVRLLVAALAGALIGLDRERSERPAGLRTNMLVSLAAALFTLTALELVQSADAASDAARADPVRVIEAVTAGVAFIAAGTIIRARGDVQGVTTAAALWLAGAAGVACGSGAFDLAFAAVFLALAILGVLKRVETAALGRDQGPGPGGSPHP